MGTRHSVHAQTAYPTSAYATSSNGQLWIDSAVEVLAAGIPAGDIVTYYVYIPASGSHVAGWHNFLSTTTSTAWVDLLRYEQNPTEFPAGTYEFAVCGNQCVYTSSFGLSVPAAAAGGLYNPWYQPVLSGNMQLRLIP